MNTITFKKSGMDNIVFHEQTENISNKNATRYSNRGVSLTSPETIQISQDGSNVPGSRRTTTIYLRKSLPYVNEVGANAVENINLTFKLSHVPTRLSAKKATEIKNFILYVRSLLGDDSVIDGLLNAETDINKEVAMVAVPTAVGA